MPEKVYVGRFCNVMGHNLWRCICILTAPKPFILGYLKCPHAFKFIKVQLGRPNDWNFAIFAYLPDQFCSKSLHLTTGQNYLGHFFEWSSLIDLYIWSSLTFNRWIRSNFSLPDMLNHLPFELMSSLKLNFKSWWLWIQKKV